MEIQVQPYPEARGHTSSHAAGQALDVPAPHPSLATVQRSLKHAADPAAPLLERLRALCMVSSKLDDFFELGAAGLVEQKRKAGDLAPALLECRGIVEDQYALLNHEILPGLSRAGIRLLQPDQYQLAQRAWTRHYFMREIRPLLTPIGLDPAHPFPQVATKALHFIVELGGRDAFGRGSRIAIMRAPRVLQRVIRMPASRNGRTEHAYILLTSLILAHLAELFPGREVLACSQFRVTRNSGLPASDDALAHLPGELRRRLYGFPVRLEVDAACPRHLAGLLLDQFGLPCERLFAVNGPVNLVHLAELDEPGPNAAIASSSGETKQLHTS